MRVTVVVLVCVSLSTTILALQAMTWLISDMNSVIVLEKNGDFSETAVFELKKLAVLPLSYMAQPINQGCVCVFIRLLLCLGRSA